MLPVTIGRQFWSVKLQERNMAVGMASRQAADEEARAEVEVLNSRLEKTTQLTKKIQASLTRLESSGKSLNDAIKPISGSTKPLQILGANIDAVIKAIERVQNPSTNKNDEETIIRRGPDNGALSSFLASVKRVSSALADMKKTNLRANQQAMTDLSRLLKSGNTQLESHFQKLLLDESRPLEPLHYITKDKPFPLIERNMNSLGLITNYIMHTSNATEEPSLPQLYAKIRGPYLVTTLQNLAAASLSTSKKKTPDTIYRQGTNGLGTYAKCMQGAFISEYENICMLFPRDDWGRVFTLTCQGAVDELTRTLKDLNTHIKNNLTTDCYLAYEIVEIMSSLSTHVDEKTGELKSQFASALKPIRETAKKSLSELLDDTKRRINNMPTIPFDGGAVPITSDVMTRLQTMVDFLRPISSIMISIGDGGWKTSVTSSVSSDQIPTLNSFDITADGKQIFAHYCSDTIDTVLSSLEQKAKSSMKGKQHLAVFILNNTAIVDRMVKNSDLQPLLSSRMADIDKWRKNGVQINTLVWREPSTHLLDVTYTNRGGQRPPSGSGTFVDSAAIIKGLSSKDKDAIKEKFRLFNSSFDELITKHKSFSMEQEVKGVLARQIQSFIEPLYNRFWDKYHEVDKGKGKYVKYDKAAISALFISLG